MKTYHNEVDTQLIALKKKIYFFGQSLFVDLISKKNIFKTEIIKKSTTKIVPVNSYFSMKKSETF